MEILLNSLKNIDSVNVDSFDKIELSNRSALINEYEIRNVLSATEVFDLEREAFEVYRIYGKIEYLSLLNGLKNDYKEFGDFFQPQKIGNFKDIVNSFDFYLVKPASSGYTEITGTSTNDYIRHFEVIATPNEFDIFPIGFANNLYDEQGYAFNFSVDFDISSYTDNFGFPLTELFLYAQYKPQNNGHGTAEVLRGTTWSIETGDESKFQFSPLTYNIGDYLETSFNTKIGDVIEYSKSQFFQRRKTPQRFYIQTPYRVNSTNKRLIWRYNPFIPFRLRYFSDDLYRVNTGTTSYEFLSSMPYYATKIDDFGNYVWREIQPQGYVDPLTGVGVDYPFVNQKRYLFSTIVFDITPDLTDTETRTAFEKIWYTKDSITRVVRPISDINQIGRPC